MIANENNEDIQDDQFHQRFENAMDYTIKLLEEMVGDESMIRSLSLDMDEEAERKLRDIVDRYNKALDKKNK